MCWGKSCLKRFIVLPILHFVFLSLYLPLCFAEYDALAKVIQQHPDRHETLKWVSFLISSRYWWIVSFDVSDVTGADQFWLPRKLYYVLNVAFHPNRQLEALDKELQQLSHIKENVDAKVKSKIYSIVLLSVCTSFMCLCHWMVVLNVSFLFCPIQLELRKKQFHVLLSTIQELQQTLESELPMAFIWYYIDVCFRKLLMLFEV